MARTSKRALLLLGPQRVAPTAARALESLVERGGPIALVTAGWEERESEHVELREHLGRKVTNLELYARSEDLLTRDAELGEALGEYRRQLEALQRLYRLRLRHQAPAVEALLKREGPAELLEPERESALEGLRALDEHHRARVEAMQRSFDEAWKPARRTVVAEHCREILALLKKSVAVCIAGGHVRVLLTRLRLFDVIGQLPAAMPIVAWSAGAMALTDRVVLFHDNPPQGKGYAELLGPGLGVCPGIVALPDARERLHLDDPVRVQMLSRRFPEALCAVLDESSQLAFNGRRWTAIQPTMRLTTTGGLAAVRAG